jgi:hypothetical protein
MTRVFSRLHRCWRKLNILLLSSCPPKMVAGVIGTPEPVCGLNQSCAARTSEADESVGECMRLMTENRVRHLSVMQNREILGIISIDDLVNWINSAQNATIEQMEQYIAGGMSA